MESQIDVVVLTYNQENYVEQTLKGILGQECSIPFRIIINDDVSSDGTREILSFYKKKYPDIIDLQFNTKNLGIPNNFYDAMGRSKSDYVAICAGDDVWIDKQKLQVQIEILEKDISIGLVYTDYYLCGENGELLGKKVVGVQNVRSLLLNNNIAAPTVCFRRKLYYQYLEDIQPLSKDWGMEDLPLWLWILSKSKGYYFNKPTCMYRIVSNSVSHSINIEKQLKYVESSNTIRMFFNSVLKEYRQEAMLNLCKKNILHLYIKDGEFDKFKEKVSDIELLDFKSILYWLVGKNRVFFKLFCAYVRNKK